MFRESIFQGVSAGPFVTPDVSMVVPNREGDARSAGYSIIDPRRGSRSNAGMPLPEEAAHRTAVIMGSARVDGNTASAVLHLTHSITSRSSVINLASLTIGPFKYGQHGDRDDFRSVIDTILINEHIVFATPVYWYSMASPMKSFFDRLTDLLLDSDGRKIGRAMAGRSVWLLTTGTDETLPPGFEEPFARTAGYFDMIWREACYCRSIKGLPLTLEALSGAERLAKLIAA